MAPDYEQYINEILDVGSGYTWTLQDVQNGMFKPKEQEDEEDVFAFFSTIEPRYENAFLYRENERFWLKLYEEIGTEIFGNSRVVEILGCSEVTATSYLKRMEDELKIIVPVEGMGKGKYKFFV